MNNEIVSTEFKTNDPKDLELRNRWRLILAAAILLSFFFAVSNSIPLFLLFWGGTAVISGIYASRSGRSGPVAAVGSLLFPLIWPFVLVLLPGQSRKYPDSLVLNRLNRALSLGSRIQVEENRVVIKGGFFNTVEFNLAELRLAYAIVPGDFKWRVVTSSQTMQFIPLDLLEDENFNSFNEMLIEAVKAKQSAGSQLILADYRGQAAQIALSRLGRDPSLLEALARTRSRRLEKLGRWLSAVPKVRMQKLLLTENGIEQGKSRRAWDTIETLRTETTNGMITSMHLVLKETKRSRLTGREKNLSEMLMYSIPPSRKEWYSAELFFWTHKMTMESGEQVE